MKLPASVRARKAPRVSSRDPGVGLEDGLAPLPGLPGADGLEAAGTEAGG